MAYIRRLVSPFLHARSFLPRPSEDEGPARRVGHFSRISRKRRRGQRPLKAPLARDAIFLTPRPNERASIGLCRTTRRPFSRNSTRFRVRRAAGT